MRKVCRRPTVAAESSTRMLTSSPALAEDLQRQTPRRANIPAVSGLFRGENVIVTGSIQFRRAIGHLEPLVVAQISFQEALHARTTYFCSRPTRPCLIEVCCRCRVGVDVDQEAPSTSWSRKNSRRKICPWFITLDCEWRHEGCFSIVENNLSEQGKNKQPKLSWKALSSWLYTPCWKFGWTGRIKTLKHQIWRECSTGCWGDSFLVLPHVFPSVGFCDYMWLPHSLQHIRTCRRTVYHAGCADRRAELKGGSWIYSTYKSHTSVLVLPARVCVCVCAVFSLIISSLTPFFFTDLISRHASSCLN